MFGEVYTDGHYSFRCPSLGLLSSCNEKILYIVTGYIYTFRQETKWLLLTSVVFVGDSFISKILHCYQGCFMYHLLSNPSISLSSLFNASHKLVLKLSTMKKLWVNMLTTNMPTTLLCVKCYLIICRKSSVEEGKDMSQRTGGLL